jgi:hypothetical protein
MTLQHPMTEKEKAVIMLKSLELREAGDEKGAHALITQIPLPPWLAKTMKEKIGADFLIEAGYNLSDAEAAFGSDWLNQANN